MQATENTINLTGLADRLAEWLRERSFALDPEALRALAWADRWLCISVRPLWFRQFWRELWLRADEMHPAYDIDPELWGRAARRGRAEEMMATLSRQRNLAHRASLAA